MVRAINIPASEKAEDTIESSPKNFPTMVDVNEPEGDATVLVSQMEVTDDSPAPQALAEQPAMESAHPTSEADKAEQVVKTMETDPSVEPVPMDTLANSHCDAVPIGQTVHTDTILLSQSHGDDDMEVDQEALDALATLDDHPTAIDIDLTAAPSSDLIPAPTIEPAPALSAADASRTTIATPPSTLEQTYSPFVLPNDTSLFTARARLRTALEQTRLLRQSFTEQVYERYGVILKAVPSYSENEALLSEICADPISAAKRLEIAEAEKKRERERTKAENEGENDPLASFGGDGLHLVLLPEEQSQQQRQEGKGGNVVISAASAAATEGLLDRIRRSRGLATLTSDSHDDKRRKSGEYTVESHRGKGGPAADRSLASSPSLSVDSYPGGGGQQYRQPQGMAVQPSRKSGYSNMLTLAPEGETVLKNIKYNAVQSALLSKGVGVSEMKRDPRVASSLVMHQRAIPKEFHETALPPLLRARQVGRMEVRRVLARRAMRSVIREIMEKEREDEEKLQRLGEGADEEEPKRDSGNDDKDGASGEGSSEISLFHRLKSLSDQHHRKNGGSDQGQDKANGDGGGKASGATSASLEIDPILAYSVMNAVGLIQVKNNEDVDKQSSSKQADSGSPIANTLGLSSLMNLNPVSDFVKSFLPICNENKRKQSEDRDNDVEAVKKMKVDAQPEEGNSEVLHIRGGGGNEQEEKPSAQSMKRQTSSSGAPSPSNANMSNNNLSLFQQPSLYNLNPAAIGSLASSLDAYQSAALAHQLGIPLGNLPSYQIGSSAAPDLSDFFLRSQLAAARPDLTSLGSTNLSHPSVLSGQLNFSLRDQHEAVTAMILREQQNVAAAAAAAAHYQAALSSLAAQNPYAAYAGPMPASISQQPAAAPAATPTQSDLKTNGISPQLNEANPSRSPQRKRSRSLGTDNRIATSPKRPKSKAKTKEKETSPLARPASAPVQPAPVILPKAVVTLKDDAPPPDVTMPEFSRPELHFTPPEPPQGLSPEIAQLILDSKFHEAYALSHEKTDQSEDLLVEFLLSLAAAVPIPRAAVLDTVRKELAMWTSLKEFMGETSFSSLSRDIISATITVCLWTKHEDYYKQSCFHFEHANANPMSNTIIKFAVDKSLSALSTLCKSQSHEMLDIRKGEVASVVNKALMKKVVINKQMDASLPMMDDILGLLDSLRMEALKAKVQERVLLATLVSRHGKMSEAFSNSYVSAIIRAGEALGHEDVCEIAQDEKCRASTMLPYDFFHDHTGLWEEPCRPPMGVYPDSTGKELKRRAHAKTVIQKSMKKLQNCLGLKGGVSGGGPYFSDSGTDVTAPSPVSTPTTSQAVLVRTNSSNLKRKGSQGWDTSVMPGTGITGVHDSIFNPGHWIAPMSWDINDASNTPYGRHQVGIRTSILSVGGSKSEIKWKQFEQNPTALLHRSTHEVKWEDVADMFLHGGSTRKIVLDLGGDTSSTKKNIIAPFVRPFDIAFIKAGATREEEFSDEDISDETVLRRHQEMLDDMMRKVVAVTEKKQQQSQPRGRKKQT